MSRKERNQQPEELLQEEPAVETPAQDGADVAQLQADLDKASAQAEE